ncbi:MAG: helix-turn-helix transcriptional regulator [Anaerolineae bacterium]
MSDEHVYGARMSTWVKVRRCLVILRRLQRGPTSRNELINAVKAAVGESAYGVAAEKALERDVQQLRGTFDLTIQSRQGEYHLVEVGTLPLLDVADEALQAMAFLYDTFKPGAPGADDVRGLLDTLVSYLPEERRKALRSVRAMPRLDLQPVDGGEIDEETWDTVERAVVKRRQLAFDYRSPRRQSPTHHVVEPYDLDFEDGHYYLDAHCLRWEGPDGESRRDARINYRVDRIVPGSARVLPTKLPPSRRKPRTYTLRYELAPAIARGGVSRRFPETQVKMRDDDWAEVTARITSPFMAAKTLLRYGENCRVLGPPEVVRLVEEAVRGMAEMYGVCGRQE